MNQNTTASPPHQNSETPAVAAAEVSTPNIGTVEAQSQGWVPHTPLSTQINPDPKEAYRKLREAAIKQLHDEIGEVRVRLHLLLAQLAEYGGDDEYHSPLLTLVSGAGEEGLLASSLHSTLPDPKLLVEARRRLVELGQISEHKRGNTWLFKVAPAA